MYQFSDSRTYYVDQEKSAILVVEPMDKKISVIDWLKANREIMEKKLLEVGGILLRNFNIDSVSEFNQFAQAFSPNLLDYKNRSTPRTKVGGKIYTSTEYPAAKHIPLHNENSYSNSWPNKIMFYCALPAKEGGETPIADSRKVYARIDKTIREEFEKKRVMYVKNYIEGVDLSWQEVFQITDKTQIGKICEELAINFNWEDDGKRLKTSETRQATLTHPVTREVVWFNQALLFNVLSQPVEDQKVLIELFGLDKLPRNSYYGDGTPISKEIIDEIQRAYQLETIKFPWQRGDCMILDNLLMAHARTPYVGERKVVVAMA